LPAFSEKQTHLTHFKTPQDEYPYSAVCRPPGKNPT